MDPADQSPEVVLGLTDHGLQTSECLVGITMVAGVLETSQFGSGQHGHEFLLDAIVEVSFDTAPLVVLRRHKPTT